MSARAADSAMRRACQRLRLEQNPARPAADLAGEPASGGRAGACIRLSHGGALGSRAGRRSTTTPIRRSSATSIPRALGPAAARGLAGNLSTSSGRSAKRSCAASAPGFFAADHLWRIRRHGVHGGARFTISYSPIPDPRRQTASAASWSRRSRPPSACAPRRRCACSPTSSKTKSRSAPASATASGRCRRICSASRISTAISPASIRPGATLLGWSEDEIKAMHVSELRHPDDAPAGDAGRARLAARRADGAHGEPLPSQGRLLALDRLDDDGRRRADLCRRPPHHRRERGRRERCARASGNSGCWSPASPTTRSTCSIPTASSRAGTPAPSASRAIPPTKSSASISRASTPRRTAPSGVPDARARDRRATTARFEAEALARAQGRLAVLGQRRHRRHPRRARRADRLCQDHPRHHRAARGAGSRSSARKRSSRRRRRWRRSASSPAASRTTSTIC